MPKVSDAHLEARRQQILDASSACFARQGFHQTTMQDICREAGLSPGAVYRYFASKEEIIAAACQDCQQQSLDLIQAAAQSSDNPLEILDFLIDYGFAWLDSMESQEHIQMNIQLWAEALRSPHIWVGFQQANLEIWQAAVVDLISRAQNRGEVVGNLDPEAAARVLLSTWHGLVLQRAFDPTVDVSKYVAVLKSFYKGTFAPRPAEGVAAGPAQN